MASRIDTRRSLLPDALALNVAAAALEQQACWAPRLNAKFTRAELRTLETLSFFL